MIWRVKYLDDRTGEEVRIWEGEAEDNHDAMNKAHEDYYCGRILEVEEIES